jgi:uncharacterized membrane protein YkvA (DUF1232 family)
MEHNTDNSKSSTDESRVRRALRKINPDFVKKGAKRVTEKDVAEIVEKADTIERRFNRDGPMGRLVEDGQLFLSLVKDYWRREYRHVPRWTLTAVVFTLLYVLNPMDLIPDALPGIGLVDDAAVLSVALLMVEQDLYDYKGWKTQQDEHPDALDESESSTDDAGITTS